MPSARELPRDALESLRSHLELFSRSTRERGEIYFRRRRVADIQYAGDVVEAEVQGSEVYETHWVRDNGNWISQCSCPIGEDCKHAYAVGLAVLADADDDLREEAPDLPPPPRAEARERVAPRDPSHKALDELLQAGRGWEREHALNQLLARAPVNLSAYLHPFPQLLLERDPEILCWRLAQEVVRRTEGWLPPALEPYRQRPDIDAYFAERARAVVMKELQAWTRRKRGLSSRSLRLILRLVRDEHGRPQVSGEARLTGPRLDDAPRTYQQLVQLRSAVTNSTFGLPADQVRLLEWMVADDSGMSYREHLAPRHLRALFTLLPNSELVTWGGDADEAHRGDEDRRAGSTTGAVVRFRPEAVRLLPVPVDRDGETSLELAFLWPDGSRRNRDEVVYLRGDSGWQGSAASFAVCDGTFWLVAEEPPRSVFEHFELARYVPIPPAERGATLSALAASFAPLQGAFEPFVHRHEAAPAIALDLRNDDWLQIRLFAHTGGSSWSPAAQASDTVVFEYTPEALWERIDGGISGGGPGRPALQDDESDVGLAVPGQPDQADDATFEAIVPMPSSAGEAAPAAAPQPAPARAWLEEPEPRRVAPGIDWLDDLRTSLVAKNTAQTPPWSDRDTGWWILINRKRIAALAEAWEQRPAGIAFFGTTRIRRLFSVRDTIRARVRVHRSGLDWLSVSAEWETEGRRLSEDDIAILRASTGTFVKLSSGWTRREIAEEHDEAAALLADLGIDVGSGEQQITLRQLAGARPENLAALPSFGADERTIEAIERLRAQIAEFRGLPEVPLPAGIEAELRPYQKLGLDFLAHASSLGTGAILADDMGLGKTLQALAWLLHLLAEEGQGPPSLVVCPASVVHNWAREAERFTPGLRVLVLGSGKERHALRGSIGEYDLVVTNYALLRRDIEAWKGVELRAAIFDEAQNIKNPDAAVTRAARELHARHRIALTGTPMENRALDLWSILSAVSPGYLGTRAQFTSRYDSNEFRPQARALLSARLRPLLLRRTKAEVAPELPDRIEERVDCELARGQRQLYLAELRRSRQLVGGLARDGDELDKNRIAILAALTRLRQICCHPALAGGRAGLESGKFDTFFDLLEPLLAEGHKVLVFSQFVRCLELLARELRSRDLPFHLLTGQTTRREKVVNAFQEDPRACAFLISLKAGGTGLNLTAASYVVVFDPWWNPAVEAQAIDRAHRIGQTRTVIAYRLLTRGTIEEKIWDLQQRKAALVRDILGEHGFARALTREDLQFLLMPDDEGDEDLVED